MAATQQETAAKRLWFIHYDLIGTLTDSSMMKPYVRLLEQSKALSMRLDIPSFDWSRRLRVRACTVPAKVIMARVILVPEKG
jgi:hypothetical protein